MKQALAIAAKDLRSEIRGKEIAPAMLFFGATLILLLSFSLPPGAGRAPVPIPVAGAVAARHVAGTLLWTSILFAALIGLGSSAAIEHQGSRIEGLIMAPVDPALIFMGKAAANFVFLTLLEVVMLPVFVILLDPAPGLFPGILLVLLMANIGLSSAGTLFGTAAQFSTSKSLVLPLLIFPSCVPILLSASQLTSGLMMSGTFAGQSRWTILMLAFDIVYVTLGAVTFEFVLTE